MTNFHTGDEYSCELRASERVARVFLSLTRFYFIFFHFFFAISLFLLFRAAQLETARRGVPPAKINTRLRSSPRDSEFSVCRDDVCSVVGFFSGSPSSYGVYRSARGEEGESRREFLPDFSPQGKSRPNLVGETRERGRRGEEEKDVAQQEKSCFQEKEFRPRQPRSLSFPCRDNLPAELRAGKNRRSRSKAGSGGSCNTRSLARTE